MSSFGYSETEKEAFFWQMVDKAEQMGAGAGRKAAHEKGRNPETPESRAERAVNMLEGEYHFKIQLTAERREIVRRKFLAEYERVFDFHTKQGDLF